MLWRAKGARWLPQSSTLKSVVLRSTLAKSVQQQSDNKALARQRIKRLIQFAASFAAANWKSQWQHNATQRNAFTIVKWRKAKRQFLSFFSYLFFNCHLQIANSVPVCKFNSHTNTYTYIQSKLRAICVTNYFIYSQLLVCSTYVLLAIALDLYSNRTTNNKRKHTYSTYTQFGQIKSSAQLSVLAYG